MAQLNITLDTELLHGLFTKDGRDDAFSKLLEVILNQVLMAQSTEQLGAEPYERNEERTAYRNGFRERQLTTRIGTITLNVPRHRNGEFSNTLFQRYQRSEQALVLAMIEMVINGVSTRKIENITEELCGKSFSKSTVSQKIIGNNLLEDDLYFLSLIDKSIRITDGFIGSLQSRNLTCMGIFLRIQMDNCMRTYAAYIAEDHKALFSNVIKSEVQLTRLRDKEGNKLTDAYLKKRLDTIEPRFSRVYHEASGYIHHSEKTFYSMASTDEDYKLLLNIGHPLNTKYDTIITECSDAFICFLNLQIKLTTPVIKSKKRYDAEND